jgi:membrane-associated phospholipid phosphatase
MERTRDNRALFAKSSMATALGLALVVVSYFFVDRPVAFFVHDQHLARFKLLRWLTYPEPWFQEWAPAILVVLAALLAIVPLRRGQLVLLAICVSVIVADQFKESIKYPCSRLWPDTWINNNPSLIQNGEYGFFPFHGGDAYASFPSGHTARAFAAVAILWIAYPRARWLWTLGGLILGASLVGMNYHFVSDVIAGGVIGGIVGAYAATFCGIEPVTKDLPASRS